jgi:calcineurin-like phosphoesterase family protein
MSALKFTSDLHLGHKNICKYRTDFSSSDNHDSFIFENLVRDIKKRDTLYFLGDVAFTKEWLAEIKSIKCQHKKLICGNHDRDHHTMRELCDAFDSVDVLLSKRNIWMTHCPIHPQELRGRDFNIHGHLHNKLVEKEEAYEVEYGIFEGNLEYRDIPDPRYLNVCVEHTDWKPITFEDLMRKVNR